MSFEITNSTKNSLPSSELFFAKIKDAILGKNFELFFNVVGDKKAQQLNKKFRQKTYVPNVLSFPYDKNSGEIFINLNKAKKEYKKFEMNYSNYITYLFIHSCLHLKGYDHGDEMEKLEKKFLKTFSK